MSSVSSNNLLAVEIISLCPICRNNRNREHFIQLTSLSNVEVILLAQRFSVEFFSRTLQAQLRQTLILSSTWNHIEAPEIS